MELGVKWGHGDDGPRDVLGSLGGKSRLKVSVISKGWVHNH